MRRLRSTAFAAPLPAAILAILVVLAPLALARVGAAVGRDLTGVVGSQGVADALVLGPVLAAAGAGAAAAVSLPGRISLGRQVSAGPSSGTEVVLAGLMVPAFVCMLVVLPSLLALCTSLSQRLPGGSTAGVALVAATLAAIPAGAVAAEGVLSVARGRPRRFLVVAAGAGVWLIAGAVLGAVALGPLAPAATALRGATSAWLALAVALGVTVALGAAWVGLAATRPVPSARASRPLGAVVRGGRGSVPAAVAALLARRDDVRLATAGALGFGVAGIAVAVAAAAPSPTPFLLAATTALFGSILCPLAVCGALLDGRWLWLGGETGRRALGGTAGLVGVAGSALPVALVGVVAIVVSGASWGSAGVVVVVVIVGSAAALVAGALIPWCREGVGDQLTSFAALAAIAITTSLAVGLVAPRLTSLGLPDRVVAITICVASVALAQDVVGRRLVLGRR